MTSKYVTDIGLEVHVELATRTKIFCACSTRFGGRMNAHTCPVCTGQPGALPVLNKKVVEYAIAVGLATNCTISPISKFDRKNYYYPDNPQNYQISQLYLPICREGAVTIQTPKGKKQIRIGEIHMEEDAGKLLHDANANTSLIDYNRAGVPLIEIVSMPDMQDATEVIAFLEVLYDTISYLGVSDCKLNEGSMRVDINLSVRREGTETKGTRTEMKNLNSFRAISRAIEAERERQIAILERGEQVLLETRRWDDAKGASHGMRSKEEASDYRYFPEPDLVPLVIAEEWIAEIKSAQPEFRQEKRNRFMTEYELSGYDATLLTESRALSDFFEQVTAYCHNPKRVSNYLMGEGMRLIRERGIELKQLPFTAEHMGELLVLVDEGTITQNVAKELFEKLFDGDFEPRSYVMEQGLSCVSDTLELEKVIAGVIAENPQAVEDYRNGKQKAIGALMGKIMQQTKGKAAPDVVLPLLKSLLVL